MNIRTVSKGARARLVWLVILIGLLVVAGSLQAAPKVQTLQADIVQHKFLPDFDDDIVSHGHIEVTPGEHLLWAIERPYRYTFELDADGATETLPNGETRHIDAADAPWLEVIEKIFASTLRGDTDELAEHFDVTAGAADDTRVLRPLSDAMATVIERIEVQRNRQEHPQTVTIFETSGGKLVIDFIYP